MANVKITQLPAASVVSAPSDVLPLVHSGVTVKATPNQIVQEVLKNPGAIGAVVPSSGAFNALTLTGSLTAGGSPGTSGQILESTGTGVQWANAGSSMVYPGAGMAVSTGSAWGTSKVTPAGDVVGTTDTQTLTNKTANALTLTGTLTAGASVGTSGQVLSSTGTGVQWINGGGTMVYPGAGVAVSTGSAWTTSLTAPSGSLVGTTDTQTLTNKTISGASNTLSNIGNASLTNSSVTINGSAVSLGGSTTVTAATTNALTIGTGLSGTSFNGSSAVTVAIDSTVATLTGSQTLTNKTISGSSNTLSDIANASLTNSSITFGSTAQALGSTVSALSGVSISGAAGSFTTLSASSTVSGTGFSTYLASPPAIGGTVPAAGNFTTVGATGDVITYGAFYASANANTVSRVGQYRNTNAGSSAYTSFDIGNDTGVAALSFVTLSSTNTTYAGANSGAILVGYGNFLFQTQAAGKDIRFATNPVAATGSVERMRIDASGSIFLRQNSNSANTSVSFDTTVQNALTLDSNGRLGVGQPSPAQLLDVNGIAQVSYSTAGVSGISIFSVTNTESGASIALAGTSTTLNDGQWGGRADAAVIRAGSASSGGMALVTGVSTPITLNTNAVERFRIDGSGNQFSTQPSPAAVNATATLTVANLQTRIITSTTAAAVTGTLPTGTLMDGWYAGNTDMAVDWSVIVTGTTNSFTVAAGTGHTVVGNMVVPAQTGTNPSVGLFRSRRTAANTWITYRVG